MKEQKQALTDVLTWLKEVRQPYITLGGYAGTGKTTLLAYLRRLLNKMQPKLRVAFCAYTGKASRVLDRTIKTNQAYYKQDRVSTIHSLIYAPILNKSGGITGWKLKDEIKADLIVVDEASMVDKNIWSGLLSFKIPILAVGDHGQLPPVEGKFNLMEKPQIKLEIIHRQAEKNPIIKLSMMARTTGQIPVGDFGSGVKKLDRSDASTGQEIEDILRSFNDDLMVLCGFNHTRMKLNQQVRNYMDFMGKRPKSGDRVICLKNNWEKGVYNGMLGRIVRIIPEQDQDGLISFYDTEIDLDGLLYYGKIDANQFGQAKTFKDHEGKRGKVGDLFDFGYALTVHKAQGSQAPKVLLIEERSTYMDDENWRRWLYTGITRAENELVIV